MDYIVQLPEHAPLDASEGIKRTLEALGVDREAELVRLDQHDVENVVVEAGYRDALLVSYGDSTTTLEALISKVRELGLRLHDPQSGEQVV